MSDNTLISKYIDKNVPVLKADEEGIATFPQYNEFLRRVIGDIKDDAIKKKSYETLDNVYTSEPNDFVKLLAQEKTDKDFLNRLQYRDELSPIDRVKLNEKIYDLYTKSEFPAQHYNINNVIPKGDVIGWTKYRDEIPNIQKDIAEKFWGIKSPENIDQNDYTPGEYGKYDPKTKQLSVNYKESARPKSDTYLHELGHHYDNLKGAGDYSESERVSNKFNDDFKKYVGHKSTSGNEYVDRDRDISGNHNISTGMNFEDIKNQPAYEDLNYTQKRLNEVESLAPRTLNSTYFTKLKQLMKGE